MKKEIKYDKEQLTAVFDQNPEADSLLITSDGNVFHNDKKSESYCKSHCANIRGEYKVLTRSEFEGKKTEPSTTDPADWRKGKLDEMIEFAKTQGLEIEKKVGLRKADLIEEIEAFIANKEVGGNKVTNHQTQE